MSGTENLTGMEIAIVGMAGRFPGADDVDAFWANIRDGAEAVTEFDEAQLRAQGITEKALADPHHVRRAVVFEGMDRFDAAFFGLSPGEAERLDPQQRLFLETAWLALEHAGHAGPSKPASVGVYAGCGANVYLLRHLLPGASLGPQADITSLLGLLNGNDKDSLATRVAYKLDLKGPAVSVQTACSTSLVAVHLACRGLLGHEADLALAGGVWLNLLQQGGYRYEPGAILSPDGHCRAFDEQAGGTVLGSGVGIVVLKRLDDALADGDTIHAVIKGSALNNDGAAKVGYTAPSVDGQAEVIMAAHAVADVSPDSIGYVEAHGTGTRLGDPIEVAALTQAFRGGTQRRGFCALGSVKTNVGHLDAAAGVTGLIKTVMALRHRVLPPSLHYKRPNPAIDFDGSPFYVNTEARPWPEGQTPRRAGVSAFGMGGTNVHVVLEEAPETMHAAGGAPDGERHVLLLSARTQTALYAVMARQADHLDASNAPLLKDVAHTLRTGRQRFAHRAVVFAEDAAGAAQALRYRGPAAVVQGLAAGVGPEVAFLFPGQGSQHVDMGRALYDGEAVFRRHVDEACLLLTPHLGLDLRTLIYPEEHARAEAAVKLQHTVMTQPALFVIGYAMAQLWISWGVKPAAMLGHSIGEYVAACLAGVFTLEDALAIVAARGRLLQSSAPGAMLAVGLPEEELGVFLRDGLDLAAVNAADACVLSGGTALIESAERLLGERGVAVRRLHVSHAFHSRLLEPVLGEFEALLKGVAMKPPSVPFVSNLSGDWITAEQACSPAYWRSHARGTVRFAQGLERLLRDRRGALLEVGSGDTLGTLGRRQAGSEGRIVLSTQAHAQRPQLNAHQPDRCLAQLWAAGVDVEAALMRHQQPGRRVPLPGYAFERQSYWIEAPSEETRVVPPRSADPRRPMDAWFHVPSWRQVEAPSPVAVPSACAPRQALLLCDEGPLADAMATLLEGRGTRVVRAVPGLGFSRLDQDRFVVDPANAGDLTTLLEAVAEAARPIDSVFHLWSIADKAPLQRGFHSLVALGQAVATVRPDVPAADSVIDLTVVTSGVALVESRDRVVPLKATLTGVCKVLPQEWPGLACRLIDVEAFDAFDSVAPLSLAEAVLAEQEAPGASPGCVAYRGGQRWVQSFEPVERPLKPAGTSRLRQGGTYLLTGGLGGIALLWARHLAETRQARLVLVARSALPPQADWGEALADVGTPSTVKARIEQIREMESLGSEVLVVQADVADEAQMREAIHAAHRRFGALHGVIHAAGESHSALLDGLSAQEAERAWSAKVSGTEVLLNACRAEDLDFMLLCSSLASVAGGLGKGAYAAGNACLDAMAQAASRASRYPIWAVNWDGWREVGMAAQMHLPEGVGIAPAQGVEVLERILCGPRTPRLIVSTLDLDMRLAGSESTLFDAAMPDARPAAARHARPAMATPYEAAVGDLEEGLADIFAGLLGISPIGVHDHLFELGGDSLLAIQVLSRVRASYDVQIHPAAFLKLPTVAALAELVETRLIEAIENQSEPNSESRNEIDSEMAASAA